MRHNGKPYQAIRGWYLGKKREAAKSGRYRLRDLYDEDGTPDLPRAVGRRWIQNGGKCRETPNASYEIIFRNKRKIMRLRRTISSLQK